jgi:SAM-dependent methyltransferase
LTSHARDTDDPFPIPDPAALWRDRVRRAWDERAPDWDEAATTAATAADRAAELDRIVAALGVRPGDRVLDAGCGSGHWAVALAGRGFAVAGVDLSPALIERATAHAARAGVSVDLRVGDLAALPDPEAAFVAGVARVVLQFVPDLPAALRELRRVLRPGGRLLASVPGALSPIYRKSWRRHLRDAPPEVTWLLPWELECLLADQGWTVRDGWGEFGRHLSGADNPFDPAALKELDRRLQQAAATTWTVVAD